MASAHDTALGNSKSTGRPSAHDTALGNSKSSGKPKTTTPAGRTPIQQPWKRGQPVSDAQIAVAKAKQDALKDPMGAFQGRIKANKKTTGAGGSTGSASGKSKGRVHSTQAAKQTPIKWVLRGGKWVNFDKVGPRAKTRTGGMSKANIAAFNAAMGRYENQRQSNRIGPQTPPANPPRKRRIDRSGRGDEGG